MCGGSKKVESLNKVVKVKKKASSSMKLINKLIFFLLCVQVLPSLESASIPNKKPTA